MLYHWKREPVLSYNLLTPTNITLSSKLGTINFDNRIISVPLTIIYMEYYTITFRTDVCGEEFCVEGNILILNCSMDKKFVISLDLNDTNYTYTCTEHVLNGTTCIEWYLMHKSYFI